MTYSIVARDPNTGDLGVAVQSHWFAAGDVVMWAEPGVGAVATQALAEAAHGALGLQLMRAGKSASEALAARLAADDGRDHRQVAMVDATGQIAAHTGSSCLREAGHRAGAGFSTQANMMMNATVWDAMAGTYERAADEDLPHRLLDALDAAEAEGGDIRGKQAAGILVVKGSSSERPWEDTIVHLRVDDHPDPFKELKRLLDMAQVNYAWNQGWTAFTQKRFPEALAAQERAAALAPGNAEVLYDLACIRLAAGKRADALEALGRALSANPKLKAQAKVDADLAPLRDAAEFEEMAK